MKSVFVTSVKGGVGKSLTAAMLSLALNAIGKDVLLIDADIDSFNLPKIFGIPSDERIKITKDEGIELYPVKDGIDMFSMGLVAGSQAVSMSSLQYVNILSDVLMYGKFNIDLSKSVIVFDTPAGFNDVHRQLIKLQADKLVGSVVVTQPVSVDDAKRAIDNLKYFGVPIISIVENMAWFKCDKCNEMYYIFGEPSAKKLAEDLKCDYYQVPLSMGIKEAIDAAQVVELYIPAEFDFILDIAEKVNKLEPAKKSILGSIGHKVKKVIRNNIAIAFSKSIAAINKNINLEEYIKEGYGDGLIQITIIDEGKPLADICLKLDTKKKALVAVRRVRRQPDTSIIIDIDVIGKLLNNQITPEEAFMKGDIMVMGKGAFMYSMDFINAIWKNVSEQLHATLGPILKNIF